MLTDWRARLGRLRFNAMLRLSRYKIFRRVFERFQRGVSTPEEVEHALHIGPHLSEIVAGCIVPIYWFDANSELTQVPDTATMFFLDTGTRIFAVTAWHVYDAYLNAKAACPTTICRLGNVEIDLEQRRIDDDRMLDLATFDIRLEEIAATGRRAITGSFAGWPPAPPWPGRGVFLAGYPMAGHVLLPNGNIDFGIYASNTVATEVAADVITCEFDRNRWVDHIGHGLPPANYNLSGLSGCPVLTLVDKNGILLWRLAGVTFQEPRNIADMILVRRADFIGSDGHLLRHSLRATVALSRWKYLLWRRFGR